MKVLVTGANGQLGMSLRRVFASGVPSDASNLEPVFTDVVDVPGVETVKLDITDLDAIRTVVAEEQVDAIVNCAAYTNVDAAEDNYELAELLNATAVENLAIAMKEVDGLLIHISTDYVFGGDPYNTPCREDQKGTPTGVYGLTKLHGEQAIERVACKYIIIRTAWLYSEYGKNFVKTILKLTAEKPSVKVVFDQVGTPTYAGDMAETILEILRHFALQDADCHSEQSDEALYGIYHFSNEGVCSWYDFAKMVVEYAGYTSCDIQPCHSDEFPSKVHRPAFSVLDKSKIKETFGLTIPFWADSLKTVVRNLCQ